MRAGQGSLRPDPWWRGMRIEASFDVLPVRWIVVRPWCGAVAARLHYGEDAQQSRD